MRGIAVAPRRLGLRAPSAGILFAGVLAAAWVLWVPRSADLAAQVYRVGLFARDGFGLWDNGWYAGHSLPAYSLTFPVVAGTVGLRCAGLLAVCASTAIFERLARRAFGPRARAATLLFVVGAAGDLYIGRLTFALGVTFGLAAVLAASGRRPVLAAPFSALCAATSPVAGLFVVLAAATDLAVTRRLTRPALLGGPAAVVVLALDALFGEGATEPFSASAFAAALAVALAALCLIPRDQRMLRTGAWLYALAVVVSFVVPSPVGGNVIRLGVLFAAPVVIATARRPTRRPPVRALVGVGTVIAGMVAWQLDGPIVQILASAGDPSVEATYYRPLLRFLDAATRGRPTRVEIPTTASHWEVDALAGRYELARGWERQLDTQYGALFYAPAMAPGTYRAWLEDTAVRYVAVPDAPLDAAGTREAALVRTGLPFLRPVFSSRHWRVYAVRRPAPLATGPGTLVRISDGSFVLRAAHRGAFEVRLRYTRFWTITEGRGCVGPAPGTWTRLVVPGAETVTVTARFDLGQALLLDVDPCRPGQ